MVRLGVVTAEPPPGLTEGLRTAAFDLARSKSVRIDREGAGPGSLTDDGLHYWVVTATEIRKHLPGLVRWAESASLREWVVKIVGEEVGLAPGLAGINLNMLKGTGERYERHTDSGSHTMVVFLNTLTAEQGGALLLDQEPVPAVMGACSLFHAKTPHEVLPLQKDVERVTLVLSWVRPEDKRPVGLDAHLYANEVQWSR